MVQLLWKPVWRFLKKLHIELSYDPAILLLGIYPKELKARDLRRYLYTRVPSRIIHSSKKAEATQVSIDRRIDKQNVIYTYSGILFSLKKEGNSDTCYTMDEP